MLLVTTVTPIHLIIKKENEKKANFLLRRRGDIPLIDTDGLGRPLSHFNCALKFSARSSAEVFGPPPTHPPKPERALRVPVPGGK